MNKDFKIRLYESGDEKEIVELLRLAFPGWGSKTPIDYWKWKYLDVPLKSIVVVATVEDKIVGAQHNILFNIKMISSIIPCSYGCDVATHPDYMGLGVYSNLSEFRYKIQREKNINFSYSQSRNPIILKKWETQNRVQFPHHISYMVRIKDINLHLKRRTVKNPIITRIGYSMKKTFNALKMIPSSRQDHLKDYTILEAKRFDHGDDVLWMKIRERYNFIPEKDSVNLNWRYGNAHAGNYIIKKAVKGDEILGFIVIEVRSDDGYNEGFIVDLLALPDRLDVACALLEDACRFLDGLDVNVVYYMVVKGHPYYRLSGNFGYIDSGRTPNVVCRFLDLEKEFEVLRSSSPDTIYFSYSNSL